MERPDDLDATRAAMAPDQVAQAADALSTDLYHVVPFESLARLKNALKQFFSAAPWSETDEAALGELLMLHISSDEGWWEHQIDGVTLSHGFEEGRYRLWVTGGGAPAASVFDRVFDGPVVPEATPNPRHVRFPIGGRPAPGVWYLQGDDDIADERVQRLLDDPDVADVLVAGDFVAVGLRRASRWEERLDDILPTVTDLFWKGAQPAARATTDVPPTRDELVAQRTDMHLLDPDDASHRSQLQEALEAPDPRQRRMAAATLAHSEDPELVRQVLFRAYDDLSRMVRRTAIDAVVDVESEELRGLLESALDDADPWIRWKAIRGLRDIGPSASRAAIEPLADDADFQVRFEAEAALRENAG